jgi:hypothetical protein
MKLGMSEFGLRYRMPYWTTRHDFPSLLLDEGNHRVIVCLGLSYVRFVGSCRERSAERRVLSRR